MSEKSALFMARTTRFHEFARSLTTTLGVEVSLATPDSPTAAHDFDLLILDSDGIRSDRIDQIAKWLDDRGGVPMLVIGRRRGARHLASAEPRACRLYMPHGDA